MIQVTIPGGLDFKIENVVLDMNGTLAVDGMISVHVQKRIQLISASARVHIITADTHGMVEKLPDRIKKLTHIISAGSEEEQKADFVRQLGAGATVAIGNGANDVEMLKTAALAIAIIGNEGCSRETLEVCDIVVTNPEAALDLLLHPNRLIATLRR